MMTKRFASLLLSGAFKAVTRTHVYPQCVAKELSNYYPSARCFSHFFSTGKGEGKKILGVFYKAHEYANNPEFLGCAENALGIREWLESQGHTYVVTSDKDGPDSELDRELPDTNILITTPFHPAYITKERLAKGKNLELLVTAGIGSDHIDLRAAAEKGLTVAEVTVAEDEVLRILVLVRNFLPGWRQTWEGKWNVAAIAYKAHDLSDKVVGTVGAGRIGQLLMQRLKGFDLKQMLYYDRNSIGEEREKELGATRETDLDTMLAKCDVVVVNTPLTDQTRGLFNKERISKMKKGAYIVNNARGAIADVDAVKEAVESGQLGGYGGDVWNEQPAPKDHPWRYMPSQAMTPHISGTTLDAQARYAAGTKDILDKWFKHEPFPKSYYIVREGQLASQYL